MSRPPRRTRPCAGAQAPATDCKKEVFEAAARVGCHEMIQRLPKGYDTMIGEGGAHLSAGQRQSIGLARAFFGRPSLILLDEPTAHLDAALAANLMERFAHYVRLEQEERDITAIVATHDLRLLNAADQVMVIQDRKITITPREDYLKKVSDLRRQRAQGQDARPQQPPRPQAVPAAAAKAANEGGSQMGSLSGESLLTVPLPPHSRTKDEAAS